MSTIRFFSGSREAGKKSIAGSLARLEFDKKGKLSTPQRYSYIFKKRMKEKREEAASKLDGAKYRTGFSTPGAVKNEYQMSDNAKKALKDVAARKAAKEAKKERKMVLVQPRTFQNGKVHSNGQVFDAAGNIVAKINPKNGKIHLMSGAMLGRYKPKSYMTDRMLQEAIDKHSPHFINLRKQALAGQTYGVHGPAGGSTVVHSPSGGGADIWGNSGGSVWGSGGSVWGMDYVRDLADRVAGFFGLK